METIEIQILAQDVNNSESFISITNCALARAIKRQLNVINVSVGVCHSRIGDDRYYHNIGYEYDMYQEDIKLSIDAPDDTLLRTILLNK